MISLIENLKENKNLSDSELKILIENNEYESLLFQTADTMRQTYYDKDVYIRGLIEISNYCKNNCYYCGIRCSNSKVTRYRLTKDEILSCCAQGYELGFRTFVLQGGEDSFFSSDYVCKIVYEIKELYPDCAITLSLGERTTQDYQMWFHAGADRYLLRHETANAAHYNLLHPDSMSLETRKNCLWTLKEIGYQVGSGFMVGSPYQTTDYIIEDLRFLQELMPDMIGIGPYITHQDTPFHAYQSGGLHRCLRIISILRLMFPYALIPSTTALGTIDTKGRELGLIAGANVVMPNLSPVKVRKKYELYDNKICTGEEAAECSKCLKHRVDSVGYHIQTHIGHVKKYHI